MRKWLREIRYAKKLSQAQAADLCGISPSFFADVERGFRNPSPKYAMVIGKALGFDWTLFYAENLLEMSKKEA